MDNQSLRFKAIEAILDRPNGHEIKEETKKVSEYFAENVFDERKMGEYLPEDIFDNLIIAIKTGKKIDRIIADQVASAMKAWALSKGCTHFTHWFQPLTDATAEKHDSFFTLSHDGKPIEIFGGEELVQQEPDASSFPSGGLRSTFEARGYTAWDPTSPAFIMEIGEGKTLCIPTIFVSYTGEALDHKAPLLKSLHALEEAALSVCRYFDKNVNKVTGTLGWEQEYFIVDEALFYARPDLVMTGRTLFGNPPAKGQQLDDHYFGSIPERVYAFMRDLEREAARLGIPLRTRHNEVAPSQFECAPIFEEINLAVDHNSLLMDLMDRISKRHHLRVLLHEKPYAGINGSGKHNNWSLATDTGKNLLSPGRTPKNNLQFLTFFVNTITAVHDNADLLRASIASAGNDFRLGANEAPPAIFSVFIGTLLEELLNDIEDKINPNDFSEDEKSELKLNIHNKIPDLLQHNTDRNRTSPFAFTGNKFEFRAVGSTTNCAVPMTALNAAVTKQLRTFRKQVDGLIKSGEKKDAAILKVLRECIRSSKKIIFGGDGYSEAWVKEAEKRGLSNIKDTPRALDTYVTKENLKLFKETGIYAEHELEARHETRLENYILKVHIETKTLQEIVSNQILPTAYQYQNQLIENIKGLKEIGLKEKAYAGQVEAATTISDHTNLIAGKLKEINKALEEAESSKTSRDKAIAYHGIRAVCEQIRESVNVLELLVDDKIWPLPKYRELLFMR